MYPNSFINNAALSIDVNRFNSTISSAVDYARISPTAGISRLVEAGATVRGLLSSPRYASASDAYSTAAYTSLAALRTPYLELSRVAATSSYAGTLNSLASVGSVSASIRDLYVSDYGASEAASLAASPSIYSAQILSLRESARAFSASDLANFYLGSASAVFSLESTYARALGLGYAAQEVQPTNRYLSVAATPLYVSALHESVISLSGALRSAWDAISGDSAFLSATPIGILRSPAIEVYTAVHAAAAVSLRSNEQPELDDEIEGILDNDVDQFESRLAALNQALVEPYRGGISAIQGGGPDWQRHAMVSFRELMTHVLHLLAPDVEVNRTAKPEEIVNNRPTRRARLSYIFAIGVPSGQFAEFYQMDLTAAMKLFDLLNGGTHQLGNSATDEQLHYLRGRIVGLVSSMLTARGY
jgi:hypothetical protein